MTEVTLQLDTVALGFYLGIARTAGLSVEQVLSDALLRLAGQLSLMALQPHPDTPKS